MIVRQGELKVSLPKADIGAFGHTVRATAHTPDGYWLLGEMTVRSLVSGLEVFVTNVSVDPLASRNGVATRMYLEVNRFVWETTKVTFGSGTSRTPNSEGLWKSFVRAGLAYAKVGVGADVLRHNRSGFSTRSDRRWKHECYNMHPYVELPARVQNKLTLKQAESVAKTRRAEGFLGVRIEGDPDDDSWLVRYFVPPVLRKAK